MAEWPSFGQCRLYTDTRGCFISELTSLEKIIKSSIFKSEDSLKNRLLLECENSSEVT